jgi:two-component system, NarL family, nitrate/nitrite sensor histidine kinase NarX
MGLLLVTFFLLVAISAGATLWGVEAQKTDALVVNLAGRQRMLVQQMTRLAKEIESRPRETHITLLLDSTEAFVITQHALRYGGEAPYLPGQTVRLPSPRDTQIQKQLDLVSSLWLDFRSVLDLMSAPHSEDISLDTTLGDLDSLSAALAAETDLAVRMFESDATRKLAIIRWVQVGFLAGAFSLLVIGVLITRSSIIEPLKSIGEAANRIGNGDLESPVIVDGPDEVKLLASSFEAMRLQMEASHQQLQTWANTLEERVNQRTQEINALYQVSRDISSRLEINYVLDSVTAKAGELLKAEAAFLCLLDDNGGQLTLHSASGPRDSVVQPRTSVWESVAGQVLSGVNAMPCGVDGCLGVCSIMAKPFQVSHLAAPLRIGERVIGALCVGSSQKEAFTDESAVLLARLANSAAVALENARLYAEAERLGILEERQRIAAEMHDGLAQTMSFLHINVDLAREQVENGQPKLAINTLSQVQTAMEQSLVEIRHAIDSLQAETPLRFTLQDQLSEIVQEFNFTGKHVSWQTNSVAPLVLSHEKSEQVQRIVREAMVNAVRHSNAQHVSLKLEEGDENIRVVIEDDGCGFDPDEASSSGGQLHFGLKIMRARASRAGIQLNIYSTIGEGTRVILTL